MTFDVAGEQVEVRITSLRKVDWGQFPRQLFRADPGGDARTLPKSYITAFHLPERDTQTLASVVNAAPTCSPSMCRR